MTKDEAYDLIAEEHGDMEEVMADFFNWKEIRILHYLVFSSWIHDVYEEAARTESIKYYRSIFGR